MTAKAITVRTQWALHGKILDDEGYRVIACSNGDLNRANFTDALGRFALGALDSLPQVSVSYLQPATSVAGGGYLALAIHWSAGNEKRYADGVGHVDNQGRPTTFTNYFCAPYALLAPHGINYLDMYKAFSAVTLPVKDGPPKDVLITPPTQRVPAVDDLAVRVAPLLLTGAPVCVLGADETSLDDRLRFIDTVMGLLPYGFRAKMTAATWTRATNRNHRFRLFFSSESRADGKQDRVVSWAAPEQVEIPGGDAYRYFQWLTDKVSPLAGLTRLSNEASFGESADSQAYKMVTLWRLGRSSTPKSPTRESLAPAAPTVRGADPVTKILTECAEHVRILNTVRVREDINLLTDQMRSDQINDDLRKRYRLLISRSGLLKPNSGLKRQEGALYETLLTLAFGEPVTYEALGQVEDCLGIAPDESIHKSLLEAIVQVGLGDLRTQVLVQWGLDQKKQPRFLSSRGSDAHALIRELARGSWHRPQHGRVLCDVTLRYLQERRGKYAPTEIQRELQRNGYLARQLGGIGSEQYQVHAITMLLIAAFPADRYPSGLDKAIFTEILANSPVAPTPALLAAVLRKIPVSEAQAAWDAFVYGSIVRMDLDDKTHGDLWLRLPSIEPEPPLEAQPEPPREALRETVLLGPPRVEAVPAVESTPGPETWPERQLDPPDWVNSKPRNSDARYTGDR